MRRNLGQMSFLRIHTMIGILAFMIPILQIILCGLQPSISATWYTCARDTFVGTLCICGGFFICNQGYDWQDDAAFNICGVCFFLIAFFPCEGIVPYLPAWHSYVHYTAATTLFLTLGLICRFLFISSDKKGYHIQKYKRNIVYKICAGVIFVCVAILAFGTFIHFKYLIYTMEWIMLYAFGTAFLVKGTGGKVLNIHDEA